MSHHTVTVNFCFWDKVSLNVKLLSSAWLTGQWALRICLSPHCPLSQEPPQIIKVSFRVCFQHWAWSQYLCLVATLYSELCTQLMCRFHFFSGSPGWANLWLFRTPSSHQHRRRNRVPYSVCVLSTEKSSKAYSCDNCKVCVTGWITVHHRWPCPTLWNPWMCCPCTAEGTLQCDECKGFEMIYPKLPEWNQCCHKTSKRSLK